MDTKNFAVGILSTTAVILLVGLLIITAPPAPVCADGMTTAAGDYILTVGRVSNLDEEHLYVLDTSAQKLIAYRFDSTRREIVLVQGMDLIDLERPEDPSRQPPATPPQPGGRRP